MKHYLSIDIGGTFIKYGIFNENAQLLLKDKIKTIPDNIVGQVKNLAQEFSHTHLFKGIGISSAGIIDRTKGEVIYAGPTIPNYKSTNFKNAFKNKKLKIHVENDVNAALLGEIWKGRAKDIDKVFCMTLGTGIGGAFYDIGKPFDGANLQANSIGYLLYDEQTKTTYEQRASTKALEQQITFKLSNIENAEELFQEAKNGNKDCMDVIENWAKEVAEGIAQIILIIDPRLILIGGGISEQGNFLIKHIQKYIHHFLPQDFYKTKINTTKLKNDAALFGAVYHFFN